MSEAFILVVPKWLADAMKEHGIWDDRIHTEEIKIPPVPKVWTPKCSSNVKSDS